MYSTNTYKFSTFHIDLVITNSDFKIIYQNIKKQKKTSSRFYYSHTEIRVVNDRVWLKTSMRCSKIS